MINKNKYQTAYIVFDENDLVDFKSIYKPGMHDNLFWVPLEYLPMSQLIFGNHNQQYFLPKISLEKDCSYYTKELYKKSQDFLSKLFDKNEYFNNFLLRQFFPLEYFWLCIFLGVYRVVSFCQDLLNQYNIKEINIIERDKLYFNTGLVLNNIAFTNIIKAFFNEKGIKVKCFTKTTINKPLPKSPFYSDHKYDLHLTAKRFLQFIYWNFKKKGRNNYKYLIIHPAYENQINLNPWTLEPKSTTPQTFEGNRIPFFHNLGNMILFYWKNKKMEKLFYRDLDELRYNKIEYPFQIGHFCFDIASFFSSTIKQYLKDIVIMKRYIDLWWSCCPRKELLKAIIFSTSPVHLFSYFLIKKIKDNQGKVVYRQHGGIFGYSDHYIYYVQNFKINDIFLNFGDINTNNKEKIPEKITTSCIEIGSKLYHFSKKIKYNRNNRIRLNGLLVPFLTSSAVSENRIKWDGSTQLNNTKRILDFFESGQFGGLIIKGYKNNPHHLEMKKYIQKCKNVEYIDCTLIESILFHPKFIILEDVSSPLIEVLTIYDGLVFVLNVQDSFSVNPEALSLLTKRVVYSESFDKLEENLKLYLNEQYAKLSVKDNSFINKYVKPFSYEKYQKFLDSIKAE